jgi:outer membrane protein assembly factor BamE
MHAMPVLPVCKTLAVLACTLLAACGTLNSASNSVASLITPYKVEVVQGNFVSKEQVAALQPGMTRPQVREILGSPLVTSVFHADRWDYVFTIRRQGIAAQTRKLTVFFKADEFEKSQGDEMPSESEFVAALDTNRKLGKVPNLQASEEELSRNPSKPQNTSPTELPAAAPKVYPPLEPGTR